MAYGVHAYADDPRNADILIAVNDTLAPRKEAVVSVFDSGFVLGDGVWEGLRLHKGGIPFLWAHLERLYEGAKALDFSVGLSPDALVKRIFDCLAANGMTYRCLADHINIVPGTDATKWERWGYAQSELAAYLRSALLSPVRCPVTGPAANPSDASPYTMWQSVAPYNEYWAWMGDTWRVVASRYTTFSGVASVALVANVVTSITSVTAPRAGSIYIRGILSAVNSQNTLTLMNAYIQRTRASVNTTVLDTLATYATHVGTQYSQARPLARTDALAGDVYTLIATASLNMDPSVGNNSSVHMEYLQ